MLALQRLAAKLRGRGSVDSAAVDTYGAAIGTIVERLGQAYTRWRESLELDSSDEELANAASIQRWEVAGLLEPLGSLQPPAALGRSLQELGSLVLDTSRAAQLLSNGYRFHSSSARCDGQALMLQSEERFAALRRSLAEQGLNVGLAAGDDAEEIR